METVAYDPACPLPGRSLELADGLTLREPEGGLPFSTDALLLAAYLRGGRSASLCELGAGTGAVSLLALHGGKAASAELLELSPLLCRYAAFNLAANGLADRASVRRCDVARELPSGVFDAVAANPPYVPPTGKVSADDLRRSARTEVCGGVAEFCAAAGKLLKNGGLFAVVCRTERLVALLTAMRGAGIEPKRLTTVQERASSAPSLVLAEGKRGGGEGLTVTAPLILKDGSGGDSADFARIRRTGSFDDGFFRR